MVAGTAPPGEECITNGSVAIASVGFQGTLGTARLVSDQRGTGSFDDRPMVAAGQHGMVWVAWSQGPDADACQDVGTGDRIEVAVSHDAGRTFSDPVAMPADGGHSAFGVRLVPLPGGQVAVSWTETTAAGDQAVLVSVLGAGGRPRQPEPALTGDGPPLALPGASFYDFPAGDIAALPDGKLVVAAPFWASGRSVIKLAAGTPGGRWQETSLSPPAGADLLLPALGLLSPGDVRLLCAVHTRLGDRLGYDWAGITVTGQGPSVSSGGLTALTPAPPGPGFFEIGEELALAPTQDGLLTAVVVAGQHGAALETAAFSAPPAATAPPHNTGTPASRTPVARNAGDIRTRRARCQHGKGREHLAARIRHHGRVADGGSAVLCRGSRRPAPPAPPPKDRTARPAPPARPQKTVKRHVRGTAPTALTAAERRRGSQVKHAIVRADVLDCPERMRLTPAPSTEAPGRGDDDPGGLAPAPRRPMASDQQACYDEGAGDQAGDPGDVPDPRERAGGRRAGAQCRRQPRHAHDDHPEGERAVAQPGGSGKRRHGRGEPGRRAPARRGPLPVRPGRRRRHQPVTAAPLKYASWSPPTTAATTGTATASAGLPGPISAPASSALSADGKMEAAPTTGITRAP